MNFIYAMFKYWKFGLILALGGMIAYGFSKYTNSQEEIKNLELDLQKQTFYLQSLEDAVALQNDLVEKLENENGVYEDRLEEASKRVELIRRQEQQKVKRILDARIGDKCSDSMDFLLQQAQDEYKWAE